MIHGAVEPPGAIDGDHRPTRGVRAAGASTQQAAAPSSDGRQRAERQRRAVTEQRECHRAYLAYGRRVTRPVWSCPGPGARALDAGPRKQAAQASRGTITRRLTAQRFSRRRHHVDQLARDWITRRGARPCEVRLHPLGRERQPLDLLGRRVRG